MTFISQIFSTKKSYNYTRYYYYEMLSDKYRDGQFYSDAINNFKTLNKIETDTEISLVDNKKLQEIRIKDIVKKYGKFNYKITNEDLFEIDILFYKLKLGKHKTKLEFHFLENTLFFYTYTFSHLNAEDKNEIKQIIQKKYLEEKTLNLFKNYIIDKNKNIIILNENIDFSISYLCNNKIAIEKILKHIDLKKVENETKDKRYNKTLYKRL